MPRSHHLEHEKKIHYPLVDGVYAIAMTFLAIELPNIVIDIFQQSSILLLTQKFLVALLVVFEYLLIFLLLYEIWSFHRAVHFASESTQTRFESIISALVLAFTVLLPATSTIIIKDLVERAEYVFSPSNLPSVLSFVHQPHGTILNGFVRTSVFFLLLMLSCSSPNFSGSREMRALSVHLSSRTIFFFLLTILIVLLRDSFILTLPGLIILPGVPLFLYVFVCFSHDKFFGGFGA